MKEYLYDFDAYDDDDDDDDYREELEEKRRKVSKKPSLDRSTIDPFSKIPFWLVSREELSPGEKLAYGRLGFYAGKDGKAYPGVKEIARAVGVNKRQARLYLEKLTHYGLIIRTRDPRGERASNNYQLLWRGDWVGSQNRNEFIRIPNGVLERRKEELSQNAKLLYGVLDYHLRLTDQATRENIMKDTGVAERQFGKLIEKLEWCELLHVRRDPGRANTYRLVVHRWIPNGKALERDGA